MFNSNPLYFIISTPDYSEERKKKKILIRTQKSFLFAPIDALMLGKSLLKTNIEDIKTINQEYLHLKLKKKKLC